MDAEKLKNRLFEKTGKKIDVDDPLFTAMLLNQIVLEEYVDNIAQVIEKTGTNIELNTGALLAGSKAVIAETSDRGRPFARCSGSQSSGKHQEYDHGRGGATGHRGGSFGNAERFG